MVYLRLASLLPVIHNVLHFYSHSQFQSQSDFYFLSLLLRPSSSSPVPRRRLVQMASPVPVDQIDAAPSFSLEDGHRKSDSYHSSNENAQIPVDGTDAGTMLEKGVDVGVDTSMPLNWPTSKKIYNMGVPTVLCFVV